MAKIEITPEKYVWPLSRFRDNGYTQDVFPIKVLGGEVAINANTVAGTDSVICATHRTNLIPDLGSLTANTNGLERVCSVSGCQTRAIVGPYYFPLNFRIREAWNRDKKLTAQRHLDIYGPQRRRP